MIIKNGQRPWGFFRQFTESEISTVKLINVEAGQRLSLQYHHRRSEFWVVLVGNPIVTVGDETRAAKVGDEFVVSQEIVHRIEAPPEGDVQVLEIAFGDFDEDDIVRVEDAYGRAA